MKPQSFLTLTSTFAAALAAPVMSSEACSAVQLLIDQLQQESNAIGECLSYLQSTAAHKPTTCSTSTVFVTSTKTDTITAGSTSTVFTFLPGNPPSSSAQASTTSPQAASATFASWLAARPSESVAAACACLGISVSSESGSKVTHTKTVTVSTTVAPPATTSTIWPCATPFPTLIPTSPYGDANSPANLSTENTLYQGADTTAGASAQACCNACYFDLPNCIQAYWYSYEGCVVSQATNASASELGSGQEVSSVCPMGTLTGLMYANDTNPAFRSTGNIAGPCGQAYTNF